MLTSKELLERTGVSRATLNNYISLGLIPKPEVKAPETPGAKARRIGHFPEETVDRIREIGALKQRGVRMDEIAAEFGRELPSLPAPGRDETPTATSSDNAEGIQRRLKVTIEAIDYPAYLVNNKFDIEWANEAAENEVLGRPDGLSNDISDRNVFHLLLEAGALSGAEGREELLRFHLAIAKKRLSKAALLTLDKQLSEDHIETLAELYDEVSPAETHGIADTEVNLAPRGERPERCHLFASFFREGTFFAYVPARDEESTLLEILSRRDLVIRDLLRSRKPYMTPLAVLVADLEDSVKICAELPPEEYFELINEIWGTMEPLFRQFYATHGKHVGDGIVYYFFPQPDCSYVLNAVECAKRMQEIMKAISDRWRRRKHWMNELKLNIGIDEGEEWFGAYQTPTHLEFTVLGDTINRAARLSDFAAGGTVWATKNILGKLNIRERERVIYGIRRKSQDDREIIVSSTFARISNLIDIDDPKFAKARDITHVPITEVLSILNGDEE